ncbi:MAG: hypothetical protein ACKPJD_29915, partial [Planctomycetaceae bacterium]
EQVDVYEISLFGKFKQAEEPGTNLLKLLDERITGQQRIIGVNDEVFGGPCVRLWSFTGKGL